MDLENYVYPGQLIGTEEEYEAGEGTYIENGQIYSLFFGKKEIKNRKITITQERKLISFFVGQKVIGRVDYIIEPIAIVKVIDDRANKDYRFIYTGENFVLRIENIKKGYVKRVSDEYKIGDIIKAKIIEIKNGEYQLSTVDDDCGVIKAYNSAFNEPRNPLIKTPNSLVDIKTNRREIRKISKDYLIKI